jgi:hypothetical protein
MVYDRQAQATAVLEAMNKFPVLAGRTTMFQAEYIVDALNALRDKANPEDKLTVEVGKSYINASGDIIEIIRMHRKGETRFGKVLQCDTYETYNGNYKFTSDGQVISGVRHNRLMDRAQSVKKGDVYGYHWPDGQSVGWYIVTDVTAKDYGITWSNDATMRIRYGCPLNYDAIRVS